MTSNVGALIDAAVTAYAANASYEENASRAQALAFITACRTLLGLRPLAAGRTEMGSVNFDSLKSEIDSARIWLSMNPQSKPTHRLASFRDYRDRGLNTPRYGTDT